MFSTGKDSIAMTDLFFKYFKGQVKLLFMYFVDGLEIKEKVLRYYEKKYNTIIDRIPGFTHLNMLQKDKKYKLADIYKSVRKKYNISWIAEGIRKNESLARRGMLKHTPFGIDERNKKLYPIADWTSKNVLSYCKMNNLLLPVEYNHGLKGDFYIPDGNLLLYLKNNFRNDYNKIIKQFPSVESVVWSVDNGC